MGDIKVQIEDLGDLTGHTLLVTLPKNVTRQDSIRIRDQLHSVLPKGVEAIIATDEMKIKAIVEERAKG